jgi:hypothetical protein
VQSDFLLHGAIGRRMHLLTAANTLPLLQHHRVHCGFASISHVQTGMRLFHSICAKCWRAPLCMTLLSAITRRRQLDTCRHGLVLHVGCMCCVELQVQHAFCWPCACAAALVAQCW